MIVRRALLRETVPRSVSHRCAATMTRTAPRFVFLEGGAATGKTSVCEELAARQYTVRFENFVELCAANTRYEPSGSVMSIKWVAEMFKFLEHYSDACAAGKQECRDNLVFIDRSFLTPWIYTRGRLNNLYVLDAMRETRAAFDTRLVLCEADPIEVRSRLLDRYNAGTEAEKAIRRELGEMDQEYIGRIDDRYAKLKEEGWFDHCVRTDKLDIPSTVDELLKTVMKEQK